MTELRIAVIIGSTRPGRVGAGVAEWVHGQAAGRDAQYEIVDIADFNLPVYDEPMPAAMGNYQHEHTKKWAEKISQFDGFVFVIPEYNHSVNGALKNAIDFIYAEWTNKAAGFVSYGSGGGLRAVEHLRGIAAELQIADVRTHVSFLLATDFKDWSELQPSDHHAESLQTLFDQLEAWAGALKPLRG